MGWKKMILGEQMPDKDDPKYRQRYEKEVNAGRKFAIVTGIDKLAAMREKLAGWGSRSCKVDGFWLGVSERGKAGTYRVVRRVEAKK